MVYPDSRGAIDYRASTLPPLHGASRAGAEVLPYLEKSMPTRRQINPAVDRSKLRLFRDHPQFGHCSLACTLPGGRSAFLVAVASVLLEDRRSGTGRDR